MKQSWEDVAHWGNKVGGRGGALTYMGHGPLLVWCHLPARYGVNEVPEAR